MLKRMIVGGAFAVALALVAPSNSNAQFVVDHFTSGDQVYDLVNYGLFGSSEFTTTGYMCANFYTFYRQEIQSCGGCAISGNGSLREDLRANLLSNTITGFHPPAGVVKIVYTRLPAAGFCNATASVPSAGLKTFVTKGTSEIELDEVPLSAAELSRLNGDCAAIIEIGSGAGQISCGAAD